jgi:hypothetical protein
MRGCVYACVLIPHEYYLVGPCVDVFIVYPLRRETSDRKMRRVGLSRDDVNSARRVRLRPSCDVKVRFVRLPFSKLAVLLQQELVSLRSIGESVAFSRRGKTHSLASPLVVAA